MEEKTNEPQPISTQLPARCLRRVTFFRTLKGALHMVSGVRTLTQSFEDRIVFLGVQGDDASADVTSWLSCWFLNLKIPIH